MSNITLDSNIIIYAHDADSPFFEKAHALVIEALTKHSVFLSHQIYLEVYRILTQKLRKPLKPAKAWELISMYYQNTNVTTMLLRESTLQKVRALSEEYKIAGAPIFDVLLGVTMMEHKVLRLYTVNEKDFKFMKGIEVVNPVR